MLYAAMRSAGGHGLRVAGVLPKPSRLRKLKALLDNLGALMASMPTVAVAAPAATDGTIEYGKESTLSLLWRARVDCGAGELVGFSVAPGKPLTEDGFNCDSCERIARQALTEFSARSSPGWLGLLLPVSCSCPQDSTLIETLHGLSEQHDVDPRRLTLQLADTPALGDTLSSSEWLTRARMKGFELGLNHVGASRASLIDLVRLPLSELALAPVVTEGLAERNESRLIAKCVCDLAADLSLRLIVDGVRDWQAIALLDTPGCHYAQDSAVGVATHLEGAWKPTPAH